MPASHDELRLDPIPASVGRARTMVAARLRDLGRPDLVESAELVVSELVTNALLHAGPPITVRVRGTIRRPRIEVGDRSMSLPKLPLTLESPIEDAAVQSRDRLDARAARPGIGLLTARPGVDETELDLHLDLLTTSGRGIGLVITHSVTWGVDRSSHGKVIWFEPAPEAREDARIELQVFESVDPDQDEELPAPQPEPVLSVRLINAPVRAIASVRRHYDELQREIRLIGLQYGARASSMPRRFFEQAAHSERHRLRAAGAEKVVRAIEQGLEYADLEYGVTKSDAAEFAETISLLLAADAFCQREQLLTLALSERQLAVIAWFLDQILSQLEGAPPIPWREPAQVAI